MSSLTERLRTAYRLPSRERWLTVRVLAGLVVARAGLAVFGFPRLRRIVERTRARRHEDPQFAAELRRALVRAARTVPGATCLLQAIVAARLLRAAGLPAALTIGVARPGAGAAGLEAHAWVHSGDVVVAGDADLSRYQEIARFGAP